MVTREVTGSHDSPRYRYTALKMYFSSYIYSGTCVMRPGKSYWKNTNFIIYPAWFLQNHVYSPCHERPPVGFIQFTESSYDLLQGPFSWLNQSFQELHIIFKCESWNFVKASMHSDVLWKMEQWVHIINHESMPIDQMRLLYKIKQEPMGIIWPRMIFVCCRTKVLISGPGLDVLQKSGQYRCSVCLKGVGTNSLLCGGCSSWIHKKCSGIPGRLKPDDSFRCKRCAGRARPIDGRPMKSLQKSIMKCPLNIENIVLYLNADGLPLFRSSKTSMWPVLYATSLGQQKIIFPVALCCGTGKPTNLDFLLGTIHKLNDLHVGLHVANRIIRVNLGAVVCDAPAKAMVKAIKLCSGYWGCDHCEQKGKWSKKVRYTQVEHLQLRNDESFRHQSQANYHKGVSPFTILPIDMITAFPVDYMHQACLGVMKRLTLCWLRGEKKRSI